MDALSDDESKTACWPAVGSSHDEHAVAGRERAAIRAVEQLCRVVLHWALSNESPPQWERAATLLSPGPHLGQTPRPVSRQSFENHHFYGRTISTRRPA